MGWKVFGLWFLVFVLCALYFVLKTYALTSQRPKLKNYYPPTPESPGSTDDKNRSRHPRYKLQLLPLRCLRRLPESHVRSCAQKQRNTYISMLHRPPTLPGPHRYNLELLSAMRRKLTPRNAPCRPPCR